MVVLVLRLALLRTIGYLLALANSLQYSVLIAALALALILEARILDQPITVGLFGIHYENLFGFQATIFKILVFLGI
jgi:hypothetical protein